MDIDLAKETEAGRFYFDVNITIDGVTNSVKALLDTGASFTCVDETLIPTTAVKETDTVVTGINDGGRTVPVIRPRYRADIEIPFWGVSFKNVLVTSTSKNDSVIIGMNIISHLKFNIDGSSIPHSSVGIK